MKTIQLNRIVKTNTVLNTLLLKISEDITDCTCSSSGSSCNWLPPLFLIIAQRLSVEVDIDEVRGAGGEVDGKPEGEVLACWQISVVVLVGQSPV